MVRYRSAARIVVVLALIILAPVLACNPSGDRSRRGDRDGYVPPEPEPERHDAPPRRHGY